MSKIHVSFPISSVCFPIALATSHFDTRKNIQVAKLLCNIELIFENALDKKSCCPPAENVFGGFQNRMLWRFQNEDLKENVFGGFQNRMLWRFQNEYFRMKSSKPQKIWGKLWKASSGSAGGSLSPECLLVAGAVSPRWVSLDWTWEHTVISNVDVLALKQVSWLW